MTKEIQKAQETAIKTSRIGKAPITLPDGVKVSVSANVVHVEGPKGKLSQVISDGLKVSVENGVLTLKTENAENKTRAQHGLMRTLIANMVEGVTKGFVKTLDIVGVGYKAAMKGKDIDLSMGFSHPYIFKAPAGIEFAVDNNLKISVKGIDKQLVGQVAADIRMVKKPEPYKGKGIRYTNERVMLKAGKSGKKK